MVGVKRLQEKRKKYYEKNKVKILNKQKERISNDPVFALTISIRKNILKAFRNRGFEKENSTTIILGWDIDHVIPTSKAKTIQDVIKINHYTNLQPLCSYINRDVKIDN